MLVKKEWIISQRKTQDGKYSITIGNLSEADFVKLNANMRKQDEQDVDNRKKRVKCLNTGEVFESIKDACNKYDLNGANIGKCCLGKLKTTGGLKWEYVFNLDTE